MFLTEGSIKRRPLESINLNFALTESFKNNCDQSGNAIRKVNILYK